MALFKILQGQSSNLPANKVNGYCYVTTDEHKFYVDYTTEDGALDRFALNASYADVAGSVESLGSVDVGNLNKPIYLEGGTPKECADFLPLSAGKDKKLTGPLGLTENVNYGTSLPDNGFVGQLFFLEEEDGPSLPTGGTAGQVLVKNSSTDGDASWTDDIKAMRDGNGNIISSTYLPLAGGTMTGSLTTKSSLTILSQDSTHEGGEIILSPATSSFKTGHIDLYNNKIRYHDGTTEYFTVDLSSGDARAVKLYGAVWNDYAEFRICKDNFKPGQVVCENNDDTLSISTYRLQPGANIVSDTFGFAIGETDDAKCPIAVSGRVLVYTHEPREEFEAGDAVCAGPNGTVSKMTREEIKEYPERIIGTVSAIPDYEIWGSGNVSVNGRIWIKVI